MWLQANKIQEQTNCHVFYGGKLPSLVDVTGLPEPSISHPNLVAAVHSPAATADTDEHGQIPLCIFSHSLVADQRHIIPGDNHVKGEEKV